MGFFLFLAFFSGSICCMGLSYIVTKMCVNACINNTDYQIINE